MEKCQQHGLELIHELVTMKGLSHVSMLVMYSTRLQSLQGRNAFQPVIKNIGLLK